MALRNEKEELLAAWRALAGSSAAEGWRTIPVATGCPCVMLAGRRFPGNEEALLVGFSSVRVPPADQLPQGHGFLVSKADLGESGIGRSWIALQRQRAGSLDLFVMMTADIIATLVSLEASSEEKLFHTFLSRIRAWQDFMRRGGDGVLGAEAEVGLFGELELLGDLVSVGIQRTFVVASWQGPIEGIQDFMLGTGAIEVKSTVSAGNFIARIGSLEQLDDSLTHPVFLLGVRLALDQKGGTLTDKVQEIRCLLREDPESLAMFDCRLLQAGFLDAVSDRYTRRFARAYRMLWNVSNAFPRLTQANVAIEIRRAQYEVDLGLVSAEKIELESALKHLGVI
jgi:hypothetical protein